MIEIIIGAFIFMVVGVTLSGIRINKHWEKAVILRLGKYKKTKSAGLFYVIPFIESARKLDTRTQVMDVETQEMITSDSVTVQVNAMVYYKIKPDEASKAILNVENWEEASTTLAQTTLRDIIGKSDLDKLLTEKNTIGSAVQKILDKETDAWGIKIETVEIKDVIIPKNMERAMAKEAEATREKRARITKAEGELEASKKLKEAGNIIAQSKNALALRQLQTYQEIGAEQNSLMIVIPSEMVSNPNVIGLAALGESELKKTAKKKEEKDF